jgi:glycine cleavage system transcriptional repressor
MAHVAVSAIGTDQPGIVAGVTAVLVDQGCNLEDTSMSILRGHFAMMLVVAVPSGVTAESLERALAGVAENRGLVLLVRAIDDGVPEGVAGDLWTVSVHGADRPGIVHRVTKVLADAGVNVVDLTTRIVGDANRPVYVMFLDVVLPATVNANQLEAQLGVLAEELGVSCSVHPADADIL